mgnify:CR=1 FL=1
MSKYYKVNNSTILYLNTSFNCIKSQSITLSVKTAGTGYTSAPTITITNATGDAGYGASATCSVSGGAITSVTMTNNGMNYNKLPTITLSGGGGTGGALNVAFSKSYLYTWNIPDIVINDLAKISAINIISTNFNTSTPYTFRIVGLQYDTRDSYFSDFGNPILSMAQNVNVCSYGSLGGNSFAIILTPQTIKQIQISVDDDITTLSSGMNANINFVIALEVEEYDPQYTQIGDVYQEAASRLKLNF